MQARGPYHLIAASIGIFIASIAVLMVLNGRYADVGIGISYVLMFVAAVVGSIGAIAAGVSIGVRHAQVLTAEAFTSAE